MLRTVLLTLGALSLCGAVLAAIGHIHPLSLQLLFLGLILFAGVAFERWRYKPQLRQHPGVDWQATGERFIDPASGKLVEVYCHRTSGERTYVEVDGEPTKR